MWGLWQQDNGKLSFSSSLSLSLSVSLCLSLKGNWDQKTSFPVKGAIVVQQCFGGFFFLSQLQLNLSLVYSTPISSGLSFHMKKMYLPVHLFGGRGAFL
jgi:hypothetical protein